MSRSRNSTRSRKHRWRCRCDRCTPKAKERALAQRAARSQLGCCRYPSEPYEASIWLKYRGVKR